MTTSPGTCALCRVELPKARMGKHLASCAPKTGSASWLHLVAEGRGAPEYWLHLMVQPRATLRDLDAFLRHTWLECCGHMSEFVIGGRRYWSSGSREFGAPETFSMSASLGEVLRPAVRFTHVYDFGTSTELRLRVLPDLVAAPAKRKVTLLARNNALTYACAVCGAPATLVCPECAWERAASLCRRCGRGHECGEEMLLPLVNSPRVGQCGYTG